MEQDMVAIKRRIESVGTTRQIAQAMQMLANTKITRLRETALASSPFHASFSQLLEQVARFAPVEQSPYAARPQVREKLYIIVGSDRGLCGPYNVNVSKAARIAMADTDSGALLITVGRKIAETFRRNRKYIRKTYTGISENPFYSDAAEIGDEAMRMFLADEVQEVYLVYTHFVSMLEHQPRVIQLLPLAPPPAKAPEPDAFGQPGNAAKALMRLEPGEEEVLEALVPGYVTASVFNALVQGAACEQAARVTSMDAAVKSSADLIDELQLYYNMARQAAITQELNEIVGGAEAFR